jgi:hypothetical protein
LHKFRRLPENLQPATSIASTPWGIRSSLPANRAQQSVFVLPVDDDDKVWPVERQYFLGGTSSGVGLVELTVPMPLAAVVDSKRLWN